MKNYSSHNVSPDQVKSMVDEVDQRQQAQIDGLRSIIKIHTVVASVLIVAVVAAWVQITTSKAPSVSDTHVPAVTHAASK